MNNRRLINHLVRWTFITAALCASLVSCKTTQPIIDSKDLSYLYNPAKSFLNPRYTVFNDNDRTSILHVKFFPSDLFFSEANPEGIPMAQLMLSVKLYNISNGRVIADTAAFNLNIPKRESGSEYTYSVSLNVEPGNEYVAEAKVLDRLRQHVAQAFIPFNTLSYTNKYSFIVRGHLTKNMLFNPVLRSNEYVNLVYPRLPVDSLFVSRYSLLENVPYPPSMLLPEKIIDYEPDTTIAFAYSDTLPVMLPTKGVYLFKTDRELAEGFTFFNFGNEFPSQTTPESMIEPLGYLASEDEMNSLRSSPRQKLALDNFWIRCGGNIEKARELIRIYYTRVLYSNYYFTSFKEGWRTERGMIYIIYGPPDKVYKTTDGEQWGYRKPVIKSSWGGRYHLKENYIFFNFRLREGIFSDNDYYLSRSETLVTQWDQAVASWRKGIVFRLDNPSDF